MRHVVGALALVSMLVLASASAGASGAPPSSIAFTASPSHVELVGTDRAVVRLANNGSQRVVVDVSRAGFALDLRGRPRIVAASAAQRTAGWLGLRPRSISLRAHTSASVAITVKLPARAEPGDHDALVLVTSRRRVRGGVAARARMGIVVVVRAPGVTVRRTSIRGLRVVRASRQHALELVVANRGNVTESFARARAVVSLERGGRRMARLVAEPRDLRPFTKGVFRFRYRRGMSGPVTARIELMPASGVVVRRRLRVRL